MCDISIAFKHETERVIDSQKSQKEKACKLMKISDRYLRMLMQHKFITAREWISISRIPYTGSISSRLVNRISGNYLGFVVEEISEFDFKIFSRLLRDIILILLNIYEDWTVRKRIFREFILIVLLKTQINQRDYEFVFGKYDEMDGFLLINDMFEESMRKLIENELDGRNLLEMFYYTQFDKRMWKEFVEK